MNSKLSLALTKLWKFRQQCISVCSQLPYGFVNSQSMHQNTLIHHSQECNRQFSTTSIRCKYNLRKFPPLKAYTKPMKPKVEIPVVNIYQNMMVEELGRVLKKNQEEMLVMMMEIDNADKYLNWNSVIDDIKIIKKAVKLVGFKFDVINPPNKKIVQKTKLTDIKKQPPPDPKNLVKKSPVVTIMGHVDHGKTTLLDYLRKSNVVDQEFGGITQHIGAFSVKLESGEQITFLDTPGHAAFSAMRARGAEVTDIIVLVVAGDDGVMEQTVESINHARSAGVPIIVAVNKMDKHDFDLKRTTKKLLEQEIVTEEFGGDIQVVPISALKGTNVDQLQEAIVALSEILDLKCDPVGLVEGRVIESKTIPVRGKVATALIQRGTLKKGSFLVAGTTYAKVRSMLDESGKLMMEVSPSIPVEISGWKNLPSAGDEILQVESKKKAEEVVEYRLKKELDIKGDEEQPVINMKRLEHDIRHRAVIADIKARGFNKARHHETMREIVVDSYEGPELSLVLKGDVHGSLQTILDLLQTYQSTKCRLNILHEGVGDVTELDVERAHAFNGIVYGFNVTVPAAIQYIANQLSVPLSVHQVIYKLFDDLLERLNERLPVIKEEETIGQATVKKVFQFKDGHKKVKVAGCLCTTGAIEKVKPVKLIRDDEEVYRGQIQTLKYFKDEVQTIKADKECGICLNDNSVMVKEGDIIQCFNELELPQYIDWNPGF